MGAREIVVDERIGETRAVLLDRDRILEIRVERWSDRATRAAWGQSFMGRVRAIDGRIGGAFVDLGIGPEGFLPFGRDRAPQVNEGAAIEVRVVREAMGDKGPALTLIGEGEGKPVPRALDEAEAWAGWDGDIRAAEEEEVATIDEALEAALSPYARIMGGGRLIIEQTAALTAIDVDAADRHQSGDPARFAHVLNMAAAHTAVRQIRRRGLGGLIVIDFTGPRRRGDTDALTAAIKQEFDAERASGIDAPKTEMLPVSRFGLCEIARQKRRRTLGEVLLAPNGQPTAETVALNGLARLEKVMLDAKGRVAKLELAPEALAWLQSDTIGWREALAERAGGRFEIGAAQGRAAGYYEAFTE